MTIKEAAALWPIIKAYAEGKTIEIYDTNAKSWHTITNPKFFPGSRYRIKPQYAYRSFHNADECWNEMQKHEPFGWLKAIKLGTIVHITEVMSFVGCGCASFKHVFERYNFADGTPFGIKEGGEQ